MNVLLTVLTTQRGGFNKVKKKNNHVLVCERHMTVNKDGKIQCEKTSKKRVGKG